MEAEGKENMMREFVKWSVMLLLLPMGALAQEAALHEVLQLQAENFEHIRFSRVEPVHYSFEGGQLVIDVDNGASLLMHAFDAVQTISVVEFEWQVQGSLQLADAEHEARRDGDDAVFKLGLLIEAKTAMLNPFLPGWLKRVHALLKFPSEKLLNLVVHSRHTPGQSWPNPYNDRVTMVAIGSEASASGWQRARHILPEPLPVVALWLMADGDNTGSRFTTRVKNIRLLTRQ